MGYIQLGASGDNAETMEQVTWEGGRPGDVNADGIPYGTFKYLVPAAKAHAEQEKARIAKMTAPWANIFGSVEGNPLGLSTPTLAIAAVAGIVGLVLLKKKLKNRKGKR